jgi:Tfp pilus assembly protein PilF
VLSVRVISFGRNRGQSLFRRVTPAIPGRRPEVTRSSAMRSTRAQSVWGAIVCSCALASGCVTTQEPSGSFVTGGSGSYGEPAAGAKRPGEFSLFGGLFGGPKADKPISPKTHLAYAQYEEARGNEAGARQTQENQRGNSVAASKLQEEQRTSYAAARKSYQHVLDLDNKSTDAIIGLARLDEVAGRIGDAEQGFLKAVRLDSNSPHALDALGQFYMNRNRWNEAISTLQQAVAAAPDDKAIRFHYGVALARSGQFDQARPQLVDAVGKAAASYNLGVILHDRGDLAGSEEQFVAALLDNPHLEQAQRWVKEVRRELQEKDRGPQFAGSQSGRAVEQAQGDTTTQAAGLGAAHRLNATLSEAAAQASTMRQMAAAPADDSQPPVQHAAVPVAPLARQSVAAEGATQQ